MRTKLVNGEKSIMATVVKADTTKEIELRLNDVAEEEKEVLLDGSLINFYKNRA